ncbi:hypothetical protein [Streptomyces sp. NPDC005408]|uniref:hypothetical protein n=1 Tax=Streptomyces sp. NPDC005408 TaxID=3155341 RepID=UPI0033BE946D
MPKRRRGRRTDGPRRLHQKHTGDSDAPDAEASANPLTRLPGSGPKQDYYPIAGNEIVSPTLRDIRLQVANLPGAKDSYWSPPSNAQERAEWIAANKEIIKAAALNSGLPPDMVAGIAWQEIGGQPGILDDLTDTIREQADSPLSPIAPETLPWRLAGDPDNTSMGPIAIQVRRGAEVLGYDPDHLTDQQRGMVEEAIQDRVVPALVLGVVAGVRWATGS